jgi:ketosteroid isomerase-like protein
VTVRRTVAAIARPSFSGFLPIIGSTWPLSIVDGKPPAGQDGDVTTPFDDPQAELAWMFLQCLCDGGDLDEGFTLLSDDFTYWSNVTRTSGGKEYLRRITETRKAAVEITLDLVACVNEGEKVVVEAQGYGVTTAGIRYDSPYAFIFETRDGRIVSLREYSDTRLAAEVLGAASIR